VFDVLFKGEVGLAEEQPAVQPLVQLLVPVLEERDDLLGARVIGPVGRDRVPVVAPPAPADEPNGG
jgi:hypothetical protein